MEHFFELSPRRLLFLKRLGPSYLVELDKANGEKSQSFCVVCRLP